MVGHESLIKLFRDKSGHRFRASPDGPCVICIYCDPEHHKQMENIAQAGIPLLPEGDSLQQYTILNEWIKLCNRDHNCFSTDNHSTNTRKMPTRVIEVGTFERPSLRLIQIDEETKAKYVALSHCWGVLEKGQRFCTYKENIDDLKKQIPYHLLPKSFQDAINVTRALGIPYLWIDSLCIIQEDKDDWKLEAEKMEDVFSFAYCTIAASSAKSSLCGFLGQKDPRSTIAIQSSRGILYLAENIDDFHKDVEKSVLNTRGWVLQERALSSRTIHFTSTQVYWECGKGIHCETMAQLRNPQSQFLSDSKFPTSGLQYYKDERIRLVQYLYQMYCALGLTNDTDRSKAILGLQKRIARTFDSKTDYGIVWKYLERTLLWEAQVPGALSPIPYEEHNTAPSWSWMAYTGNIRYMDIPFGQAEWKKHFVANYKHAIEDNNWDGQLGTEACQLSIGELEFSSRVTLDSANNMFDPKTWKGVIIGWEKNVDGDNKTYYVLLIHPTTHNGLTVVYKRVGVGRLLKRHLGHKIEKVYII